MGGGAGSDGMGLPLGGSADHSAGRSADRSAAGTSAGTSASAVDPRSAASVALAWWGHASSSPSASAAFLSVQGSPRNDAIAAAVWAKRSSWASNTLRV